MKIDFLCREDMATATISNIGKDKNDKYVNAWAVCTNTFNVDSDPMYIYSDFIKREYPDLNVIEILDIYVPESCRRKGIGTKLIKSLRENFGKDAIFMVSAGYTNDELPEDPIDEDVNRFKEMLDNFYKKNKFKPFKPFNISDNSHGYIFIPNLKKDKLLYYLTEVFETMYS